jgi:dolichyl-phosphate-mannose--protein O-mannosyl transferase
MRMPCSSAVHAVTQEDLLLSAFQAYPKWGAARRPINGLSGYGIPKMVTWPINTSADGGLTSLVKKNIVSQVPPHHSFSMVNYTSVTDDNA